MDLMGTTVRENLVRSDRRPRPTNPDSDVTEKSLDSDSSSNPEGLQLGFNEPAENPDSNPNPGGSDWGYCTEEKLEELLMNKLESLYNEAIAKFVGLGYDEDVALKAILRNGHCYGNHDALTNVMNNTMGYLNSQASDIGGNLDESKQVFSNLTQLRDFSMACLVCLLRRVRPSLSRGDAMWCLLMADLHVGRASTMEVPVDPKPNVDGISNSEISSPVVNDMEKVKDDSIGVTPDSCKFHGGWGFGNRGTSEFPVNRPLSPAELEETLRTKIAYPKWPVLTPTMNMILKTNVALFAKEYRANQKRKQVESEAGSNSLSSGDSSSAVDTGSEACPPAEENLGTQGVRNKEKANLMWKKFCELSLEENGQIIDEAKTDDMLLGVIREIKELEKLVKERKDWAHQKAMQAARKLCHDLTELKMLRMEKEDNQRLKQGKPATEDPTMKRLSEMENALRKASGQVDRANLAVRRLEVENAEIRAEMEASKLSASESVTMCLEVARREKKYLKRLLAWEKQRAKLQEDLTAEKQKIIEFQEELLQAEAAKKTAEAGLRREQKARDLALTQVEEERRLKEAAEANIKRRHEALRSNIELDFQRYKDDLQRLEQELARIKTSTDPDQYSTYLPTPVSPYVSHPHGGETIARMLHELDDSDDGIDRACILCLKDEVSVVFLPCAHQVLCVSCNDAYGKKGKAKCPTCRVPIEQRIRVFGASS
ncbi:MND1-interacting protein 1-like [Cynara cardunculus var. scolymus]|nr:MND1-interacting protein 1-like [Cynara cardunculus var. scolymus]XP_024996561.1 MND1-interacting protein 1-like [Cynara cardunculus var. scolymus]